MKMQLHPLAITLDNVTVSLAGKVALRNVSWNLHTTAVPGHWAVLGENGAGKSTLLRLIRGDVRPDQDAEGAFMGRCLWNVDGEDDPSPLVIKPLSRLVSAEQHRLYVRRGWSIAGLDMILSGFADSLLPSPAEPGQEAAARALAQRFGIVPLLDMPVTAMSQGQFRLVLLARAMVSSPKLLLLDEPFDGLDHTARGVLHAAVDAASEQALIVCTAHREGDLPSCITRALHLSRGRVVACGPVGRMPDKEKPEPAPAPKSCPSSPHPVPDMKKERRTSAFALELHHVDVYVDRAKVLHSLTWKLPLGENWRIAGPNGSGKSTLLRLVAGFEHAALGGTFRWFGKEHPPLATRLRQTGYLSDLIHATYTYDLTGLELVATGCEGTVGAWRKQTRRELALARHWIGLLGLEAMAATPVSRLSSGTARRFFLARALVGSPKLLLLDEPCSGLDAASRVQFLASLETVLQSGIQCLYVSHHDSDVPPLVTHTLYLENGRITGAGVRT